MKRSKTFIATPPGTTIKEQLEDRIMSQKEFAMRMEMSEKHISKLINGDVALTQDVARRLELVLGVPASFWNNLEAIYREKLLKVEQENALDEDIEISKSFPYSEMAKIGWLPSTKKNNEKVLNLRQFFEVVKLSLLTGNLIPGIACRRQMLIGADVEKMDYSLIAWAQKAKLESRSVETQPINLKLLADYIPRFREMTKKHPEEFCPELVGLLAQCGVALIFLPHLKGSFLHGATFIEKNKIVIGLTVRGKDADRFWFSFFHELAHILMGHIYQIDGTSEDDEIKADEFASDTLIPPLEFAHFTIKKSFTRDSIIEFADKIGVDAGIVVGRLQKDHFITYDRYQYLKVKYKIQ